MRQNVVSSLVVWGSALLIASLAQACGGSRKATGFEETTGGDGGVLSGGDPALGDGGTGGGSLLEAGCATATAGTQRAPVYMLIVLDGSGSMTDNNKWGAAIGALDSIFDDLLAKNDPTFGVGLIGFSDSNDATCCLDLGQCGLSFGCHGPYPSTADVPLASVDQAQHDRLRARIDSAGPFGGTVTYAALQGGFGELEAFVPTAPLPPNGKKVLVLMTDGVPSDGSDTNANSALVAAQVPKEIQTFAVGVGPFPSYDLTSYDPTFLGTIAKAGGTAAANCNPAENQNVANVCYFQVTPGGSVPQLTQQFTEAINKIRSQAASCEFLLDKSGGAADPSQVNVIYTDQNGQAHVLVQDSQSGWSYDDPNDPTKVILHGHDCDQVRGDPEGKISIVLGCKTVTK